MYNISIVIYTPCYSEQGQSTDYTYYTYVPNFPLLSSYNHGHWI